MRVYSDIQYGKLGNAAQKLDVLLPDEGSEFPVFVYFHGGGIVNGDKAGLYFTEPLTKKGVAIVSVNYRMFPEAKYPEFIEDCAESVAWTFEHIKEYCTPKGIYVGGSSAGGYLSMMLQFDSRWLTKHGISPLDITGYIHDAGQPTAHFNVIKFNGIDPRRVIIDDTAPLYHIGVDEKYSPMLIIVSDNDRQNRYEQTMLVMSTLNHFGHTDNVTLKVMNGTHCAYVGKKGYNEETGESVFANIVSEYILG